jgi:hypothetical protein
MKTGAKFSIDRVYRYSLHRIWNSTKPRLAYVLLNPSTADETSDDATIKRCITRAFLLDFGAVEILNLFALRSTDPHNLLTAQDPIGPDNDAAILEGILRAKLVICGWGTPGSFRDRGPAVLHLIRTAGFIPHALKTNSDGSPSHPLYLKYSLSPFPLA